VSEQPPREDSEVDALYRRASAADPNRPSEAVRRAVLGHAAKLAAERRSPAAAANLDFKRPAANEARWRPATYGGLAAAVLAGLIIVPHYLPSSSPRGPAATTSGAPAPGARAPVAPTEIAPAPTAPPAPAAPPAPTARQLAAGAADAPKSPLPERSSTRALGEEPQPFSGYAAQNAAPAPAPARGELDSASSARLGAVPRAQARMSALAGRAASIDSATALRQAAESGDVTRLKTLLLEQIDVDARDSAGRTALMLAVLHGQSQAVDALLAGGADPNAADSSGNTPLRAATDGNESAIIEALRRAGAH